MRLWERLGVGLLYPDVIPADLRGVDTRFAKDTLVLIISNAENYDL